MLSGLVRRYAGVRAEPVRPAGGDGFALMLGDTLIGVPGVELADGRVTELNLGVNPAELRGG